MPDHPDSSALPAAADALVAALRDTPARLLLTDAGVRGAVRRYAATSRTAGVPPERLLVALKAIVNHDGVPALRDWYRGVVTDRVIVWAIKDYYGLPEDVGG